MGPSPGFVGSPSTGAVEEDRTVEPTCRLSAFCMLRDWEAPGGALLGGAAGSSYWGTIAQDPIYTSVSSLKLFSSSHLSVEGFPKLYCFS